MVNVERVPVNLLLNKVAQKLKEDKRVEVPEWVNFLKAGIHTEKAWENDDWYVVRLASTLRKLYLKGPIGISKLSAEYGGRVDRGSKPYHPAKGSRYIIRNMFQTLEELGYAKKDKSGRVISPQGISLLEKTSKELIAELSKENEIYKKFI
ncbi:MAG: 30S ribosomal protein S19e [Candidatus Thermoplasmatota archaeon]|jgi:small subunit ribosomal protein S19e|nr:30S ribosomal protein S19e [Candidatus Thermoplasmatota archaeon]MCL5794728.1 30S ribosomal protein S19e [Candidatus Thermoplasmatota archaeon]